MSNKETFIQNILKFPQVKAEYEKQRGYYQEYIGDDWSDEYFRFDKPFFYEFFGRMILESEFSDLGRSFFNQPDEYFGKLNETLNHIKKS